jgi:riboflavin kinase/FMN adenylyltransferase
MKIIRWEDLETDDGRALIDSICKGKRGVALTIGGFDGPHRGHEALFSSVMGEAAHHSLATCVVTFTRSPGALKKGDSYLGDVSTLNVRLAYLSARGFDLAVLIDFSGDFGKMSGGVFFEILVKTVRMRYVAVGPDFRCGHRLDTGAAEISAMSQRDSFRFDSIRQVELEGLKVSSSAVRKAVQSADFALAERLLGRPFLLDFTAPSWENRGSSYEAPRESFSQILPRRGVYRVVLSLVSGREIPAKLMVGENSVSVQAEDPAYHADAFRTATIRFRLS